MSIAIFFFAFTSIVANYYYGETNLRFIHDDNRIILIYRLLVTAIVFWGSVSALDLVWTFADVTMALMTLCNLAAIIALRRYVLLCLADYRQQRRLGDPIYRRSTIPQIAAETTCWPE